MEKSGNCVVIQHPTGGYKLKRNIALVKGYVNTEPCETPDLDDSELEIELAREEQPEQLPNMARPQRARRRPQHLQDYVV